MILSKQVCTYFEGGKENDEKRWKGLTGMALALALGLAMVPVNSQNVQADSEVVVTEAEDPETSEEAVESETAGEETVVEDAAAEDDTAVNEEGAAEEMVIGEASEAEADSGEMIETETPAEEDTESIQLAEAEGSVTLSKTSLTLGLNDGDELRAYVNMTGYEAKPHVTWVSDDESVVSVDNSPYNHTSEYDYTWITPTGVGTTTIRAMIGEKTYATCKVTIHRFTSQERVWNSADLMYGFRVSQKGGKLTITWGGSDDVDGYYVYAAYCGESGCKKVKTIKSYDQTSLVLSKLNGKKIDFKKNFKCYVAAYCMENGKPVICGKTKLYHVAGKRSKKYTNAHKVSLSQTEYWLGGRGQTAQISAEVTLVDPSRKEFSHTSEFRYFSTNTSVAAVSSTGVITAGSGGECYIFVIAQNGKTGLIRVGVQGDC